MIDLHCHILPGIDDGPATIEESLALARCAAQQGSSIIVATSHVSWEYRNRGDVMAHLVESVNSELRRAEIPIVVVGGAEIAFTIVDDIDAAELSRLTLGGGSWLLIEPPFTPVLGALATVVASLQERGYGVVIAHPERCPGFMRDRRSLEAIVASGALLSITAGSLTGRFGRRIERFARQLLTEGLVHNIASDAHNADRRPPDIPAALEQSQLGLLGTWLTDAVPAAMLADAPLPPRPAAPPPPRRRPWRL